MNEEERALLFEAYLNVYSDGNLEEGKRKDLTRELTSAWELGRQHAGLAVHRPNPPILSPEDVMKVSGGDAMRKSIEARNKRRDKAVKKLVKAHFKQINKESVDYNDIILEHLLSEGYVDNDSDAYVMLNNMSEGWKREILHKAGKLIKSAAKKAGKTKPGKKIKKFVGFTALGAPF